MSRGPGRLQRAVLDVLAGTRHEQAHTAVDDDIEAVFGPHVHRPKPLQQPGEYTTADVCSALSDEWWWDETFTRQVRRALDRLHATGCIDKRLVPNLPHYRDSLRTMWRLVDDEG
ncbi:MAG TPA: hypothetical protein VHS03_04520 [Gaiellaceae bacterium]|jgi:hypothetical protein|nr:hypothetical protein [Gaiellaceae bacterium]